MTGTLITVATRADGVRRAGAVGVPVAGVETRLRGESGEELAHDGATVGDLQVRGATLFDGYLCLLYTSPSPRDRTRSLIPSSA